MTMRKLTESLLDEELAVNENSENGMDNMTVIIIHLWSFPFGFLEKNSLYIVWKD